MVTIEEMAIFCKKKGFIFPNSEIYNGLSGFFDYGPLGVELENNIKKSLWTEFVQKRDDIVGINGSIIANPKVWQASGHVANFADVLLACKKCGNKVKADTLEGISEQLSLEQIKAITKDMKCPKCKGDFDEPKPFNLMFQTYVGPSTEDNVAYLRPETAQLIFTNFKSVFDTSRVKLPFGIAQVGKAFRNEISPRDFLFRCREFQQFEIEFFVNPGNNSCPSLKEIDNLEVNLVSEEMQKSGEKETTITISSMIAKRMCSEWHGYWLAQYYKWFLDNGIKKENIRLREHYKDELAHYARACFDIEYNFPFGWKEIHGNADRSNYDLTQHQNFSKTNLEIFDEATKSKVLPAVNAEPSQGIERAFLTFMFEAYNDDKERGNVVLKLHPRLAPIKVGVFPLLNKPELEDAAKAIHERLKLEFNSMYDRSGSVGRRYARADEIGVPYCITVDFETITDKTVTIRFRDTTEQIRVKIEELESKLKELISKS